jgi:hypothetical protein
MRESTLDKSHDSLKSSVLWSEQKMNGLWHDNEVVEEVVAFSSVMLEGFEE